MDQPIPTIAVEPPKINWLLSLLSGIVILLVGITVGLMVGKYIYVPKPTPTPLPADLSAEALAKEEALTKEDDPTANWKTFTSQRAGFNFQYPPDWPVDQCSIRETYQFDNQIEHVDFAKDCVPNDTSESFGFVIVEKVFGYIKDPIDYIQERESSSFRITAVTPTQIGDTKGYLVTINPSKSDTHGNLSSGDGGRLYVIKDYSSFDLVYIIALTNPKYLGWEKERGITVFNQILSTFKFVDQATPKPTCKPRPACLDATPRCMIAETSDMCPPNQKL